MLDANGFAGEALLGFRWHPWCDIGRFKSRVAYVELSDLTGPHGPWDRVNHFVGGGRHVIFPTFELRPGELAPLLTAWRERALAGQANYGSSSVSQ